MKFAHIVPQDSLHILKGATYHMALAHLVGEEGYEVYTDFYSKASADGAYVIMDNGVIEGDQKSMHEIIARARLIGANEIILPDVFLDADKTIESTIRAWNWLQAEGIEINTMIVPHGKSIEEWLYCLEQILEAGVNPTCIGIPKVLVKTLGRDARLEVVHRISEVEGYKQQALHLLGCHEDILEIKRIATLNRRKEYIHVRGVDTALCYVHSRNGKTMLECSRPDQAPIHFDATIGDKNLLEENIAFANSEINGEYLKPQGNVVSVNF